MPPSAVMSIDQGTTSTRVVVMDQSGAIVASAQREHRQHFPRPGWVEHDPVEIWENTRELSGLALTRARMRPADIAAVGITNQRETTVLWDADTGRPVHRAIVWQDARTDDTMARLRAAGHEDAVRARTGLPLASYFAAGKIAWILEHVPEAAALAGTGRLRAGTIDSWLLWNLTGGPHGGVHATDVTNASRTLLMDLETLDWDEGLAAVFGIDPDLAAAMLPRIHPSVGQLGTIVGAEALNGVPVSGILGDQQAATFGQAAFGPGDVKNTYGTGCFLLQNTGTTPQASSHGLVTTVAYQVEDAPAAYALEGSVAVAGSLVQWLRDNLGIIRDSAEVEALAGTVEDNGGVYFVPAFSGLYAPYWRPDARGLIAGLTGYATAGHLARAALEATAYQSRDVLEAVVADTGQRPDVLRVDGGMTVNDDLMQFQADILGVPVERPEQVETTAVGAAHAAGLAAGVWSGLGELAGLWRPDRRWEPRMDRQHREDLLEHWDRAVRRSMDWVPGPPE
ncbi:glycerol kinase GlpK [Citricoccus sp. SGAir0253]|uniref:glycerol kinase GlpK n=1 Tax=Citricoccus sp. SGAir0253 TaxID=2567881 RepID=UPI0010CD6486|nr:glycerol kinase GlpK [Citricoccus sp. SGAir0253]QCU77932.1 glycerol kinase GlpK [Citricoccus sp. SGAir0253]